MSYGTHKAIGGLFKAQGSATESCQEAIRRFEACHTKQDFQTVLVWAKSRGGFFLRTKEEDERLYEAYKRAKTRCTAL